MFNQKQIKFIPTLIVSLMVIAACETTSISSVGSSSVIVSQSSIESQSETGTNGLIYKETTYNGKASYIVSGYEGTEVDVIIPNKNKDLDVVGIGEFAFGGFGGSPATPLINSIFMPDTIEYLGQGAFIRNSLTNVHLSQNLKVIGEGAFYENQLSSVLLPNKILYLGNSAFRFNKITNLTIPDSLTSIGFNVFADNKSGAYRRRTPEDPLGRRYSSEADASEGPS